MTKLDIATPGRRHARNGADPLRRRPRNPLRLSPPRPATGTPLVLLQHFSGNIDAWDPAVVNALAADRPVIAFDNAGVGRSTGQTPDNIAAMAKDAVAFIHLLGFSEVDLLGFSLGGCVAQQIAAEHERLVRKLILVGTAPKGGEEHLLAVLQEAFSQTDAPDPRLPLFFTKSSASQSSGLAFLKRTKLRKDDRDTDNGSAVTDPQAKALITWCATPDPGHAMLRAIRQPALVVSGSHDTMLPANNAYAMFKELSNAQLVLYPNSGHGALFQHHEMFVSHVRTFLDAQPAAGMTPGVFRRDQTHFIHESCYGGQMTIAKVEVERFSLTSSKPFDAVVAALKSAVGQPDMVEFFRRRERQIPSRIWSALYNAASAERTLCSSRNSTWATFCVANPDPGRPGSFGLWSAIHSS